MAMKAEPPRTATGRKIEARTIRTTIAVAYGIAVATSTIAVSRVRSCCSSCSSLGRRSPSRPAISFSARPSTTASKIAIAPQIRRSARLERSPSMLSAREPSTVPEGPGPRRWRSRSTPPREAGSSTTHALGRAYVQPGRARDVSRRAGTPPNDYHATELVQGRETRELTLQSAHGEFALEKSLDYVWVELPARLHDDQRRGVFPAAGGPVGPVVG